MKPVDPEQLKEAMANLDSAELSKWTPLIRQLDKIESRLPYVVRSHFINFYVTPGLGYGDEFEQKATTLNLAQQLGLLEFDSVPHPQSRLPVRTIRLNRDHEMVKVILAQEPQK